MSLQSPWLSTAVLQTPQEGSSSRVSSRYAVWGRVIAASNRGGRGALPAEAELRTRAVHARPCWVCPGTTTEFSTPWRSRRPVQCPSTSSSFGSSSQHQAPVALERWRQKEALKDRGQDVLLSLGTNPSRSLCEIPFLLFCLRQNGASPVLRTHWADIT